VKYLRRALVNEDVLEVAVPQAYDVTSHGVDSGGARVCQPPLKPVSWLPEVLQEKVVQAGLETRHYLLCTHATQSILSRST
jgi:hypothetical protein